MFLRGLLASAALASLAVPAGAVTFSVVDGNSDNGASLVNALLAPSSGLTVLSTSYIGSATQAATFTGFNLTSTDAGEPTLTLADGILLTSGNANLPTSNTSASFGTVTGTGSNAQVDAELAGVPSFDGTFDQNVLSFTFTVDPGITSVSAQFVFGSEEFPEFPGFADSLTFFVDGVNFAKFPNGNPVIQEATTQAFFAADNSDGSYGIEYDGLSNVLNIVGLLNTALTTHTITIVVADDGDQILDAGAFLANLKAGTATGGGGIVPTVPVPAGMPLLLGALAGLGLLRRKARRAA